MADDVLHRGTSHIQSIERAAAVLSAFSREEPALGLVEMADRLGLPKATAHRYAASLVKAGLLAQVEGGRYTLGVRLIELGAIAHQNLDLVAACRRAMQALARASGENVLLFSVDWDALETVIVERVDSPHALAVINPVGRRARIGRGMVGVALLAGLRQAELERAVAGIGAPDGGERRRLIEQVQACREQGYALQQDEYLPGVSAVGVPVVIDDGRPRGAILIVGPSSRVGDRLPELGELLAAETALLRPPAELGAAA